MILGSDDDSSGPASSEDLSRPRRRANRPLAKIRCDDSVSFWSKVERRFPSGLRHRDIEMLVVKQSLLHSALGHHLAQLTSTRVSLELNINPFSNLVSLEIMDDTRRPSGGLRYFVGNAVYRAAECISLTQFDYSSSFVLSSTGLRKVQSFRRFSTQLSGHRMMKLRLPIIRNPPRMSCELRMNSIRSFVSISIVVPTAQGIFSSSLDSSEGVTFLCTKGYQ